ncbi:MAG TPA: hypothetical protein VKU02_14565, partial [Gemmataceae bacterium]|nr:hypothetical protein [Gemmataceae bacterium]
MSKSTPTPTTRPYPKGEFKPTSPGGQPQIWKFQITNTPKPGDLSGPTPLWTSNTLLTNPVGIVMGTDGNLIVLNQDGSLVRVTPSGTQTPYSASPLPSGMKAVSLTVDPTLGPSPGTIFADAIDSTSTTGAATVWSVSPTTSSPTPLWVPPDYLSLAAGMLVGNDGSLYIATSPAPSMTRDQAAMLSQPGSTAFPTGVIHMTVNKGALNIADTTMTRAPGLFCVPQDVVEDSQGNLYVADEAALEQGAIIQVDPSGRAKLLAWGQNLNGPTGITLVNNSLYVINSGDSSAVVHSLVQVDPNTGEQSEVNDLLLSDGTPLKVLSGIAPDYGNTGLQTDKVLVLDQGGNVQNQLPGQVYTVDFMHGTPDTYGSQFLPSGVQQKPDALAVDPLTGTAYAATEGDEEGSHGAVVKINVTSSPPELDTITSSQSDDNLYGTDGIAVGFGAFGPSTNFVDILGKPYDQIVPRVTAVNTYGDTPNAAQKQIALGGLLSLVTGLKDYRDPTQLNLVNFETNYGDIPNPDDPTQLTNMLNDLADETASAPGAAIVNSPALDGHFSLQLSRTNSV